MGAATLEEASTILQAQRRARSYFALQAVAGALWWVAVFVSPRVRHATLGGLRPELLVVPDAALFVGGSALVAWRGGRRFVWVPTIWTVVVTVSLLGYGLVTQSAGSGVVLMIVASVASAAASATLWFGYLPTGWFFIGPFAFRAAPLAPTAHHLRRSLAQLVVFWTTFFVVIPAITVAIERRLVLALPALDHQALHRLGAVVFVVASALGLWSCVTMARAGHGTPLPAETARDLVMSGPYRIVRNPMAVAGAIQTAAIGLYWSSWIVVALAVAGSVVWNEVIRPVEEADLAGRFGEAYEHYRSHVRCWVPRI